VINLGNSLPREHVEHWPEVFGEVTLNAVPLSYLNMVLINFKDGRVWEIRITTKIKKDGWKSFERSMMELCKTYEESISFVDFKLDTERVKKDIERLTSKFLKRSKL
jgi:hypothetical protein